MSKLAIEPRPLSLITFTEDYIQIMLEHGCPFKDSEFIYVGEIPNMLGHCVIIGRSTGKLHIGYHIENFRELTDEET
jgi:hypothetical protein